MSEHVYSERELHGKTQWLTPKPTEREIWDRAVAEAKREPVELRDNRPAIRRALKESRWQHTKRVRSILP